MPERKPNQRNLDPDFMAEVHRQGFSTLNEFVLANGLAYMSVARYADCDYHEHKGLESLVDTACSLNMSIDEFVNMVLSKKERKRTVG